MPRRPVQPRSQLMELFLAAAGALGLKTDRELSMLGDVTPDNVANWRDGSVKEFKSQTFATIVERLTSRIAALKAQLARDAETGIEHLEIEGTASPAELQREFNERVAFDYLGHRFLYYEPQGALAWERLIGAGYDQDRWVAGVLRCAESWLEVKKSAAGAAQGPLARWLGVGGRQGLRGLDVICLGVGDGSKEVAFLERLTKWATDAGLELPWLSAVLVDVSIPLLVRAARSAREHLPPMTGVLPFCSDFEEGALAFSRRLPSAHVAPALGRRLVMILGNTFGNLRDEEQFVRHKLSALLRPEDAVWIEVALKPDRIETDPLFRLTREDNVETAADTSRRILLEGPYRRWEVALGRRPSEVGVKVWVRQDDDSCRIPGSVNFCHDLMLKEERRGCTMLYSRRYELNALTAWFEGMGFALEGSERIDDSRGSARVVNLLLTKKR